MADTEGKVKQQANIRKKSSQHRFSCPLHWNIIISSSLTDDGGHYCDNVGDIFHLMR